MTGRHNGRQTQWQTNTMRRSLIEHVYLNDGAEMACCGARGQAGRRSTPASPVSSPGSHSFTHRDRETKTDTGQRRHLRFPEFHTQAQGHIDGHRSATATPDSQSSTCPGTGRHRRTQVGDSHPWLGHWSQQWRSFEVEWSSGEERGGKGDGRETL